MFLIVLRLLVKTFVDLFADLFYDFATQKDVHVLTCGAQ